MSGSTLIVIAGPTAIGKTELAIKIADHFQTEIVSADSRQFYKEMEIGTAKPSPDELGSVKHHFINSLSVTDDFSVGEFEIQAIAVLNAIFKKNKYAVLAGGSGLFIKAITEGLDNLPKADPSIRSELNLLFEKEGIKSLREKLEQLDPEYYNVADLNNPQRIIRALEVTLSSNKPFSRFHTKQKADRPFKSIKIGLNIERPDLYDRINTRVDIMFDSGLINEVKSLLPYRHLNALNTVGYSEIFDYLDGKITLEQAKESIKQNTRRFAKRQLTWFRKDTDIHWFEPFQYQEILDYIHTKL
ncbi:tRNA (adenosine(37)-N6)-dimethylallyltransferase MiaA [Pedobacter sp. P351]|uniref:tRNA (adenosine(37)-N6)-dimethylallyltransferase MiaA n=1 Tax=Pedobacter superstes TaxID=3133441 RepID=UPI00309A7F8D